MLNSFLKFLVLVALSSSSILYGSDVLVIINGQNITSDVAPKNFKKLDKKTQKKILNRLIEKRLASDYALSTDIINTKKYKKALKHVLQMSSSTKQKNKDLANILKKDSHIDGYTTEQLNSKKGLLAFDFILDEKAKTVNISEEEMKKYYQTKKYKYDTPAMTELLSIVVEKKETAEKIIKQIKTAKDKLKTFSELASKYSLAPSAKNYGYFGKIAINKLNKTLKPALKDLQRGDFTKKPIKTEFGYQIYYVLNRIPEFNSTFETVKTTVKEEMTKQKVKEWAINKIKELKANAKIEILK